MQDVAQEGPQIKERYINITCILPQGNLRAAHKRATVETPQFKLCCHKQNGGTSGRANGVCKGFNSQPQIYALREIPVPEKPPSRPGFGPGCPDGPALVLSSISPQASTTSSCVLLLLPQKIHMCEHGQGASTGLPAPPGHRWTFCYQTTENTS